jgi:phage repressor protein C with HTH and peptisase S24 domain
MSEPHERLRAVREKAGYATAADAARAMGVNATAYFNHENGWRGLTRAAERYARFYRVSLEWLLTGRGEPSRAAPTRIDVPVMGRVGAGAVVDRPDDVAAGLPLDDLTLQLDGDFALEVVGDSMYPRFMEGEQLIVDGRSVPPSSLLDTYAVVQIEDDGRRLVKKIRRGRKIDRFTLWSHNAPDIEEVRILCAWRIKCVWCL